MEKHAIILAAGKGKRMNVDVPKCAVKLCGKSMTQYIVDYCENVKINDIVVVVGYKKEQMMETLKGKIKFAIQDEQKGTGHAVMCAKGQMSNLEGVTLIFPGDMPLVGERVINELIDSHIKNNNQLTIVSTICEDPKQYGRIYRENGLVKKIVEYKDATDEIRRIKEVNSGLFCVDTKLLFEALSKISCNNNAHEYYLTDIVEILDANYRVDTYVVDDDYHLTGINDMLTLRKVEEQFLKRNY